MSLAINTNQKGVGGRFIVRVIMEDDTHMLPCSADMTFRDVLDTLSKKKQMGEPMMPQHYRFCTLTDVKEELDMTTLVMSAQADQFMLAVHDSHVSHASHVSLASQMLAAKLTSPTSTTIMPQQQCHHHQYHHGGHKL
jgi:hypothetical protein